MKNKPLKILVLFVIVIVTFNSVNTTTVTRTNDNPILKIDTAKAVDLTKYTNIDQICTLYTELLAQNISNPKIVISQIILETGWLQSKYAKKHYNICGFEYKNKPLKFDSWKSCVTYYKKWQSRMFARTPVTLPQNHYYNFLDSLFLKEKTQIAVRYAEDINYEKRLKSLNRIATAIDKTIRNAKN